MIAFLLIPLSDATTLFLEVGVKFAVGESETLSHTSSNPFERLDSGTIASFFDHGFYSTNLPYVFVEEWINAYGGNDFLPIHISVSNN